MSQAALYIAFFLSGVSGLIYQVVWVRFFGNAFGNTVQSAALVTAVFMLGLGIGSLVAGRWIDRRPAAATPLKAYALAECLIAAGGLALAALLPQLGDLTALLNDYQVGQNGWHEVSAMSFVGLTVAAVVLLLPVTTLMGATLTLLIRHVLHANLEDSGWRVGLLYGANTGGAALGAFATDFALVPVLGLFAAASCAALANLIAALIAMRLAKDVPEEAAQAPEPEVASRPSRQAYFVAAAVVASGFAAMGFEMAWFRFFNITMGGYRSIFSLLLAVILTSMWMGSVTAGALHRRFGRPALLFMGAQSLMVVTTLALLAIQEPGAFGTYFAAVVGPRFFSVPVWARDIVVSLGQLRVIVGVVTVPSFLMGFAYPLSNAIAQSNQGSIGRTAGGLYLANTVGAVSGSVATGLWLIPAIGIQSAILVLSAVAVLAIILVGFARDGATTLKVPAVATIAAVLAVGVWAALPSDHMLKHAIAHVPDGAKVLTTSEGPNEVIAISENPDGARQLSTNGHNMSSTTPASLRYMRLFSHFPLLHIDEPKSALVICFGVGNTVHAASLHPLERIEIADLSAHVLSHASYFERWNRNVLDDPRVNVYVQDGRTHLRTRPPGSYDLVTLEPPPLGFAGVSSLYSREFYELARSRLKPGGFVTQWLPAYQVPGSTVRSIIRAFQDVFPEAILLIGAARELILVGRAGAELTISLDDLVRRLDERPAVRADLESVQVATLNDFIALYAAGPRALGMATSTFIPVTDDHPILEYARTSTLVEHVIPASIFLPVEISRWCTDCWVQGQAPDPRVPHIDQYLSLMFNLTQTRDFRTHSSRGPHGEGFGAVPFPPGVTPQSEVITDSPFLSAMFSGQKSKSADR